MVDPSGREDVVPSIVEGISYFKGIEANVTDENGTIDIPEDVLPYLDVVLLGLHVKFARRQSCV